MSISDLDHNKLIISDALPKINPSQIKIQEQKGGVSVGVDMLRNINDQVLDDCHTPTKDENKIPIMLAPPPAPRKPVFKTKLIPCKRKLFGEIQVSHQIVVKREEIDAFFKSSFEELASGNSAIIVKRCKCT